MGKIKNNGLILNLKKTNYMIFSTRRLSTESDIKINNVSIERKREARFLGVIVDEKLNWG